MLKKFRAIYPEEKEIHRQPKAAPLYRNYRGEYSPLLEELDRSKPREDMPWEEPPAFNF